MTLPGLVTPQNGGEGSVGGLKRERGGKKRERHENM